MRYQGQQVGVDTFCFAYGSAAAYVSWRVVRQAGEAACHLLRFYLFVSVALSV